VNDTMTRAYRYLVTVYVEGDDPSTLPEPEEVAEHIATQVQDEEDHNLSVGVKLVETEDYPGGRDGSLPWPPWSRRWAG